MKVTNGLGTKWCAYAFAAIALVSLPAAISSHSRVVIVSWLSQTFRQLAYEQNRRDVRGGSNLLGNAAGYASARPG